LKLDIPKKIITRDIRNLLSKLKLPAILKTGNNKQQEEFIIRKRNTSIHHRDIENTLKK
jgi:hypothetical protein